MWLHLSWPNEHSKPPPPPFFLFHRLPPLGQALSLWPRNNISFGSLPTESKFSPRRLGHEIPPAFRSTSSNIIPLLSLNIWGGGGVWRKGGKNRLRSIETSNNRRKFARSTIDPHSHSRCPGIRFLSAFLHPPVTRFLRSAQHRVHSILSLVIDARRIETPCRNDRMGLVLPN